MSQFKQFALKLLTVAPVHIGDGHTYTKKEYIYEKGEYYFPDMGKLYQHLVGLGQNEVTHFENFLLGNDRSVDRLIFLLKNLGIKERNFGGYKIKETGFESEKTAQNRKGYVNNIDSFIKNPYNEPYIPGSSLKGALRTILCNVVFETDNTRRSNNNIPWGARSRVAFNDIFHNIRVSDSRPLSLDDLILTQKIDYSTVKSRSNAINLYRESIKPLKLIEFTITCEGQEAIRLVEELEVFAKKHYQAYYDYFLNELPEEYRQDLPLKKNILYLGAGSGFWTKTIINQADPKRHRKGRTRMVGKGVYKLTNSNPTSIKKRRISSPKGKYEMGKCYFEIKEIQTK